MPPTRDVVIIGGGVMGCAVALRLAQRGLSPLVLERSVPGADASSAAAGILAPQQEAAAPGPAFELGLASRARFPSLVRELEALTQVDCGYRPCGLIALFDGRDPEEQAEREARVRWQRDRGLAVEELTPAEARRLEPALGDHVAALRFADEAQVDPPRLMRALQLAAARAGAEFATAYVRRVHTHGGRVDGVEVEGDTIRTTRVVVAAGSWSTLVEGTSLPARAVRPMRGQLVELETRPPPFSHVVFAPGGYLVPRSDGRIVVGSTMELVGYRKEVTAAGLASLLALASRAVPSLAEAPVRRFWANFRPYTDDHLPLLGATSTPGLFLATGHFRNGILLTPITADAVAAVVCDEEPPVDLRPFAASRLPP